MQMICITFKFRVKKMTFWKKLEISKVDRVINYKIGSRPVHAAYSSLGNGEKWLALPISAKCRWQLLRSIFLWWHVQRLLDVTNIHRTVNYSLCSSSSSSSSFQQRSLLYFTQQLISIPITQAWPIKIAIQLPLLTTILSLLPLGHWLVRLTLPMMRLLLSKTHKCKDFWKPSEPCHVGIHWKALTEYFQMSTHLPGFQSFFRFFASFRIGQISHQQHKG